MKKAAAWLIGLIFIVGVAAAADFQKGDRVEAKSYSSWYPATIIDVRAGEWKVTYDGYSSGSDEWVGADKLRRKGEILAASVPKPTGPVVAGQWKTGDRIEALSYGSWYPSTIVESAADKWKVHYDGYTESSDEWVPTEKLRRLRTASWKTGDLVEALSYSTWYPAQIIEVEASRWKVHYDNYGSSSDEWLNVDRIRARGAKTAGGSDQSGKSTETYTLPARPAGAKGGIEGAFLRVESYYWSSRLNLSNQGWFFTKDGRFSREPEGGFTFKDLAAGKARKTDGTYWIKGDKITFAWADGSEPTEYDYENKGDEQRWDGLGATRVKPFKKGWRFDGKYEGGASISGMASSNTIAFRPDGTFGWSSIASFSTTSNGTTVSGGSQGDTAGTYEFDGYTLTMTHKDGTVKKHTVFAFGDQDAAGRPEYIYRDGTMMKRQK